MPVLPGDREGPEVIPAHTRTINVPEKTTCSGCVYFKDSLRSHSFTGGSVYVYQCAHEEAYETPEMRDFGRRTISEDGKGFGSHDNTPSWCPFLRGEQDEN